MIIERLYYSMFILIADVVRTYGLSISSQINGPDQDDLDQRYIEALKEEERDSSMMRRITFALQELGSRGRE